MKPQSGVTLIEMILYIGIIALMATAMVGLYIEIIRLRARATDIQEVNESVRLAATKIGYEIRRAKSINGIGSSLSLVSGEAGRNPTIFYLNNGRIQMTVGSSIAYITSNLVNISTFNLQNLSSGDSSTQDVRYTVTGVYNGNSATVIDSAEIRSK